MAGRKSRSKSSPRRRSSPSLNVVNLAQTYLQTAIITQAAFRTTPYEFFTGQQTQTINIWKPHPTSGGNILAGTRDVTGYMPVANGTALTLPELFGMDKKDGTSIAAGGGQFWTDVKANIELTGGWMKPAMQTVALNVGFTVGKRIFKDQLGIVRKGLKMAKLDRMVKV